MSEFINYELDVIDSLEELGEMTTSDAQGVLEAHENIVQSGFDNGLAPEQVAKLILSL